MYSTSCWSDCKFSHGTGSQALRWTNYWRPFWSAEHLDSLTASVPYKLRALNRALSVEQKKRSLPAPLLDHVNWVLARVMRRVTYR